jgi:hypothetical protein
VRRALGRRPEATDVTIAKIVADDEDDVGAGSGRSGQPYGRGDEEKAKRVEGYAALDEVKEEKPKRKKAE